jgi:uncharacterized hydrophobic protein (TIGR00341 family)
VRLVQATIPTGKRDAILSALDEEAIDYTLTEETSGREFSAVVTIPLPQQAVEPILETLRAAGLDEEAYTVVIEAETVISDRFEELTKRYEEEPESDERISREEIQARAKDLAPDLRTYLVMTIVSAVIATAGLLLDSPAVVVGSMVIAPLIGPAMTTSVGTVLDDAEMFVRGAKLQAIGFLLSVGSAGLFALIVKEIHLVPPNLDPATIGQVRERLSPDFLSLAVALGAGTAGAMSLSSGVSASLVGVMIAVALVPPAATVGIGIAWAAPAMVLGSLILVLVNFLSINLAALGTFWYQGYRPENWFQIGEARTATLTRIGFLVGIILLLSLFLGGVTYGSYQRATFEENVEDSVGETLDRTEYAELSLLETRVNYASERPFLRQPEWVVVTIGYRDPPPDGLADHLEERIRERTGRSVAVELRYVAIERSGRP